ncbi:YfjP family GTPase [Kribbella sp. NBC_01245]|uniref:YfjP family GTPase n=1 Tax=Kribbella sp. NBC_01245 TaxID=2903578 RepID=UPI002E2A7BD6|nr:YfjP family GTPase [Kribbella sp. NBC_01245]
MTGIVEAVKGLVRGSADVLTKIEALQDAAAAGRGRLDPVVLSEAAQIVDRAGQRLKMSGELTVVALAGATGSGKSSLFNAITELDLAAVGVRRPTTSMPLACVWGDEPAGELLNWLGIPRRHQVAHRSSLEDARSEELDGLVLLDLPDHDSTEMEHRLIVDRLVELVDALIWVVDPQKYADAALHNRYLKPLSSHAGVMIFVLNHADELSDEERKTCMSDFTRLLKADGITNAVIVATSATTGDGLDDLRTLMVKRVKDKKAARERLGADVERVADRMAAQCGEAKTPALDKADTATLVDALAEAAGVPVVVDAVRRSYLQRARGATGWPVTKWLVRFKPDPLRRLHLDRVPKDRRRELRRTTAEEVTLARTSLPAATPVQRARVDTAVRNITTKAAAGLSRPWADSVRSAIRRGEEGLSDELDTAVARTDLGAERVPRWWSAARFVQWALFLVALGGALWLGSLIGFAYLQLDQPSLPEWQGIPYATIMLIGGVVLGVLVAVTCRLFAAVGAKRRASAVDKAMRAELATVADSHVINPALAELDAYSTCRDNLSKARS